MAAALSAHRPPVDDGVGSEAQVVPGADPLPVLGHGDVEVPRAHRAVLGGQDVLGAVVGEAGDVACQDNVRMRRMISDSLQTTDPPVGRSGCRWPPRRSRWRGRAPCPGRRRTLSAAPGQIQLNR